jgi:hypothetical protein
MARLSDLVQRTSEVTGTPVPAVRELGRRLREGGLIRTGKGGRYGGSDMTQRDAARLLTALLITKAEGTSLTNIVSQTKTCLALKAHGARGRGLVIAPWNRRLGIPELCELKPGHSLEDAFTALIAVFSSQHFEGWMRKQGAGEVLLTLNNSQLEELMPEHAARIFIAGFKKAWMMTYMKASVAVLVDPTIPKAWSDFSARAGSDLFVESMITGRTFKAIGDLLQ